MTTPYVTPGYWVPGYADGDGGSNSNFDPNATIISQYANSPTIVQLIRNMDTYINPGTNFDDFYTYVWNIETAQGFGLDILGRIVNIGRTLEVAADEPTFGFTEGGPDYQPFNQAPFYNGPPETSTFLLSDSAYRTLILMKALLNISNSSAASINQLLKNLFQNRGQCYVRDDGDMQITFVFKFKLLPFERAILTRSNAIPKPAAVRSFILEV